MKKTKIILCAILCVIACLCFFACGKNGGNGDEKKTFSVSFNGTSMKTEEYESGYSLSAPTDPVKEGYLFLGWYSDPAFGQKTEFPITVDKDVTLYAKFRDYKDAFAEARKNTVGDSSSYEYDYTIDAVATVKNVSTTGKTDGNAKVNKKSDVNFYDTHVNSGVLFYDGSQYNIRKKTNLTALSFNEKRQLRKIEKSVVDENHNSAFTAFAKALFKYEDSDLKSIVKTSVADKYELKTATNFSTTLEVISKVLNNKIVLSLLKNVPENSVNTAMFVSFTNGNIKTYEYVIKISVSEVTFTLKYSLQFKNVNELSDITTATFEGVSITDSQIDAAKNEVTGKINEYKNRAASSYDFKVKTGVDYGATTNAINVTVKGSAKRRIVNGEVFFHNIVEVDSDLKNGDLYKSAGLKDVKVVRSKLANGEVYDFEKKTLSTEEYKVENYKDNDADSYYLLDVTENVDKPAFIQKITDGATTAYRIGVSERGAMNLLKWLNKNINLDPLNRVDTEVLAFGSMNEKSLKVEDIVFEVVFVNDELKSIEISSKGNVEVAYPLSRDFTQAKPAGYDFSVKIDVTAVGEKYNPYETTKEAKKDI